MRPAGLLGVSYSRYPLPYSQLTHAFQLTLPSAPACWLSKAHSGSPTQLLSSPLHILLSHAFPSDRRGATTSAYRYRELREISAERQAMRNQRSTSWSPTSPQRSVKCSSFRRCIRRYCCIPVLRSITTDIVAPRPPSMLHMTLSACRALKIITSTSLSLPTSAPSSYPY
ncbi:hypothetical protein C8F01DRAFT_1375394 [Mycena amicta]|nr:hypothetical protein C8F01DRAFT_1375394 [Mycena amicta]